MLGQNLGIPRTEKWPKTGHADDWVYCDWVFLVWPMEVSSWNTFDFCAGVVRGSGLSAADWWLTHEPDEDREKNAGFKLVEDIAA